MVSLVEKMPNCCQQRSKHRGMCLLTTFAGVQLVAPQEGAGVLLRVSAAVGTAIVVIHAPTNSMRTSEYTVTAAYAQKPCTTGSHKLQVPQNTCTDVTFDRN